jgi:hypothetical protein
LERARALNYELQILKLVSDRNRDSRFRPKPNILQQKTTEYSVSAEYSALFLTFGRKSMIHYLHTAKFVILGQEVEIFHPS